MTVTLATKTKQIIENSIKADQGTAFRAAEQWLLPKMSDAYAARGDAHRSHFGFSNAADECAKKLWYNWKWVKTLVFEAQTLRLFNRGHLEEARFLAMLVSGGFEIHFETEDGGQFKFSDHNGHAGSALDAVVNGIPDIPDGEPALVEMKTHNHKSYTKLEKLGLHDSKPVHYGQMQIYMRKYDLKWGLYMAINKNDDHIYLEVIPLAPATGDNLISRVGMLIYSDEAPERLNESPGWFECKFCAYNQLCHFEEVPEVNCRTCTHSVPIANKEWHCSFYNAALPKDVMLKGCDKHLFNPHLLNNALMISDGRDEGWMKIAWKNRDIMLGERDDILYMSSEDLVRGDYSGNI